MTTEDALAQLGVRPNLLTDEERARLDEEGFVSLEGVLDADQLARIRTRLDELLVEEGEEAGKEVHQEAGTDRLANLVDKDPIFEVCFTHSRVLAAVAHVLRGDVQLSSLSSRAPKPGEGHQHLHGHGGCQTSWLIDDMTPDNGPTRIVLRTHGSPVQPYEVLEDPVAPHPDEVLVTGPAGAVAIMGTYLWHSGTASRSDKPRRVVHAYFTRRDQEQMTAQRDSLRPETRERLSSAARHILNI